MPRPRTKAKPAQGNSLTELRKAAGLSQYELAEMLGVPQSNGAFGSTARRRRVPICCLRWLPYWVLGIVDLLNPNGGRVTVQRSSRPPGKLRKVFDDVARLPRRQQEHIVRVVSALVMQYEQERR